MAEIEHFVHKDRKNHPKFKNVASLDLQLLPAPPKPKEGEADKGKKRNDDERVLIVRKLGDAVADGMINNQTIGYFIGRIYLFLVSIGIKPEFLRFRQHGHKEMAHYASDCWDAEIMSSYVSERSCWPLIWILPFPHSSVFPSTRAGLSVLVARIARAMTCRSTRSSPRRASLPRTSLLSPGPSRRP